MKPGINTEKTERRQYGKSGRCRQKENSSDLIQKIAETEAPELRIIQWEESGKTYYNHAITKRADLAVMRRWVGIIADKGDIRLNELG